MTTNELGGARGRSLALLGALTALATSRQVRNSVVGGTKQAISTAGQAIQTAGEALDTTVKPAIGNALGSVQDAAQNTTQRAATLLDTVREEAPNRAQALLDAARERGGDLAGSAQERAAALAAEAQQAGGAGVKKAAASLHGARQEAGKVIEKRVAPALAGVASGAGALLEDVQERVQDVLGETTQGLEGRRRQAERAVNKARREAEKELRAKRKEWKPEKLERAVAKRVAPLHKHYQAELKVLEKQARRARKDDRQGVSGAFFLPVLIGVGAIVVARVPAVRQRILDVVEGANPDAGQALRDAGRNIRNVIGSVWLERLDEGPKTAQNAGTGSAAAASPAGANASQQPKDGEKKGSSEA